MPQALPAHALTHQIRHFLISIGMFVLILSICFAVIILEQNFLKQRLRANISQHAIDVASRLQTEINSNVFLANGLIAHITAYPDDYDERIIPALKALHSLSPHLRNIGIAPGNRISHVYPVKGNRAAIGLYYPDVPTQWPAVKKAIETRTTVLAGPLELKQGGSGLISRTPVYLEDGTYWGIISLVIDTNGLFKTVYSALQRGDVQYAIRNIDPFARDHRTVFGDIGLFEADSIQITLAIPGGVWQLAARPIGGWQTEHRLINLFYLMSLLLAVIGSGTMYFLLQQRSRVLSSEMRMRTILRTTHDGVIVVDENGLVREFNPAAEKLFGYSHDEILGDTVYKLFPKGGLKHETWFRRATRNNGLAVGRQMTMMHKDGKTFPVEITIGEATSQNQKLYVGVARDITERLRLESQLRELANTDGLTNVFNRRAILERGTYQFKLAKRTKQPMTVVMLDLDHFKSINDTHGHQSGDEVLIAATKVFRDSLRETDSLGRYGGEEFIALLPATRGDQAIDVMARICENIRNGDFRGSEGQSIAVTVSLGAADIMDDDGDLEATILRADAALYQAKETGRDRFVLAEAPAKET